MLLHSQSFMPNESNNNNNNNDNNNMQNNNNNSNHKNTSYKQTIEQLPLAYQNTKFVKLPRNNNNDKKNKNKNNNVIELCEEDDDEDECYIRDVISLCMCDMDFPSYVASVGEVLNKMAS